MGHGNCTEHERRAVTRGGLKPAFWVFPEAAKTLGVYDAGPETSALNPMGGCKRRRTVE